MTYETDNEEVKNKFVALLGGEDIADYWRDEDSETWVFPLSDTQENDDNIIQFAESNAMLAGGV